MTRLASVLQIRPGEGRLALLIAGLFALLQAGQGIGANAADGLFFVRFGVDFLPYMFIVLGAATLVISLLYTAALGRFDQRQFFVAMLLAMAAALVAVRLLVLSAAPLVYPVVWLAIYIVNALLGTFAWNVATEACDTRQAKRLFSLFTSAGILGSVVGNTATGLVAVAIGTENLLLLYAGLLLAAVAVARLALARFRPPQRAEGASIWSDLRAGLDFVRGSFLLKLVSVGSVLFSILYFSISFPFSQVVSRSFPGDAQVAGFLGLFTSAATALTFVVSLLVASRLYARLGIVSSILLLPITYLAGFVLFAADFSLSTGIAARLGQMVILNGVASSAYNALFNVVPGDRRGQVLAFESGVPGQVGVMLSGVLLILGQRLLGPSQIFVLGMIVAAACGGVVWLMRGAYGRALVSALRAGRFDVFAESTRGFARLHENPTARWVAEAALSSPKPAVRRLAAQMLAPMNATASVPALVQALADPDEQVRTAVVEALSSLEARDAAGSISPLLADAAPAVRAAALRALIRLEPSSDPSWIASARRLLSDGDAALRAEAAVALARFGRLDEALPALKAMLCDPSPRQRLLAVEAAGQMAALPGRPDSMEETLPLLPLLHDEQAYVRAAACRALAGWREAGSAAALADRLADEDPRVREAAAESLRAFGEEAVPAVLPVLSTGGPGQLAALSALPPGVPALAKPLREYARVQVGEAREWRQVVQRIPAEGRVTRFIRDLAAERAERAELRAIRAAGLLGHAEEMERVEQALRTRDGETRAAAIEALETLGDKELARQLVPLLDAPAVPATRPSANAGAALEVEFDRLLNQGDIWVRALGVWAAAELRLPGLRPRLESLARDPEPLVRQAARESLARMDAGTASSKSSEDVSMETLQTVSSLERMLLLREVPLFAGLEPDDLKQVADVAQEHLYEDGTVICKEGEKGDALYVIVSGQVRVTRSAAGDEVLLATRGAGDFVGEMAIIDSTPRSATVRAEGQVRALVIQAEAFDEILSERPQVSRAVLRVLSRRLREQNQQVR